MSSSWMARHGRVNVNEGISLRHDYEAAQRSRERQEQLAGYTLADGPRDDTERKKQVRRQAYRNKRVNAGPNVNASGLEVVLATEEPEFGIGYGPKNDSWHQRRASVALAKLDIEEPA